MSEIFKSVVSGTTEMQRTLGDITRIARRPQLVMRNVAAVLEDETEKNFIEQGRPNKWEKLAEATKFKRVGGKKGYTKKGDLRERSKRVLSDMKILQDSGLLASSVHSQHGDDWAMIGAGRTDYARIHQLGGQAGVNRSVTIPARPYLPFTPDMKLQQGTDKVILDVAVSAIKKEIG